MEIQVLKELQAQFKANPWPDVFVSFWSDPDKITREINIMIEKGKQSNGQTVNDKMSLFYNMKICTPSQYQAIKEYVNSLFLIQIVPYIKLKYPYLADYITLECSKRDNCIEVNLFLVIGSKC